MQTLRDVAKETKWVPRKAGEISKKRRNKQNPEALTSAVS
jgi:hypothetical protein